MRPHLVKDRQRDSKQTDNEATLNTNHCLGCNQVNSSGCVTVSHRHTAVQKRNNAPVGVRLSTMLQKTFEHSALQCIDMSTLLESIPEQFMKLQMSAWWTGMPLSYRPSVSELCQQVEC